MNRRFTYQPHRPAKSCITTSYELQPLETIIKRLNVTLKSFLALLLFIVTMSTALTQEHVAEADLFISRNNSILYSLLPDINGTKENNQEPHSLTRCRIAFFIKKLCRRDRETYTNETYSRSHERSIIQTPSSKIEGDSKTFLINKKNNIYFNKSNFIYKRQFLKDKLNFFLLKPPLKALKTIMAKYEIGNLRKKRYAAEWKLNLTNLEAMNERELQETKINSFLEKFLSKNTSPEIKVRLRRSERMSEVSDFKNFLNFSKKNRQTPPIAQLNTNLHSTDIGQWKNHLVNRKIADAKSNHGPTIAMEPTTTMFNDGYNNTGNDTKCEGDGSKCMSQINGRTQQDQLHTGLTHSQASRYTQKWAALTPFQYQSLLVPKRMRKKRKIDTQVVEVIRGSVAQLPCDLSMKQSKDSVQLVLWIKEGMDTPLYSYDYRELQGGRPKETKPNLKSTLARRISFRTDGSPAALFVERVEREDAGVYRCRVDFLLTPTRNSRVNLSVIVPPSRAKVSWKHSTSNLILSNTASQADSGTIGPFREGEIPTLICSNDDGSPLPNIKWYDGDQMVDESYDIDMTKGVVTNAMELPPLSRRDLGRRFTCQASNINKTQPATFTVTIGMILKILSVKVEIIGALQANVQSDIQCQASGSIPIPSINWWLGSKKLQVEKPQVQEEGYITVSTLHFTPRPEDDGSLLICQAINNKIVDDVIQDTKLLSVTYIPKVSVRLGRSLNPSRIKEGDDVYFECSVVGKPPAFNIQWKHNDVSLEAGSGIFVSNMSLVVQGVSRDNGGDYTCHATNTVGIGVSPPLHLDVKYAPVCATKLRVQHSVAKLENAEILCKVHANPPSVTFRWTFNNTAEAIDVPDGRFVIAGTESRVNYTPMNELDYGTLLCWANNSIGVQDHPCVFQIVAAGKPDPPHNCRVFDVTISSLQVTCLAGDDGGLTQNFIIQVFKIGSSSPVKDITNTEPSFSVTNLRPATAYKILVVSLNDKGASRPTELKAYTIRAPETQEETSAEPTRDREGDKAVVPFGVIIGSSVAAVPLALIIVFILCRRRRLIRRQREFPPLEEEENSYARKRHDGVGGSESIQSVSCKESSIARSSIELPLSTDSSNADDFNPDVISHASDHLENQKIFGNVATISSDPRAYYLRNGEATYIPRKCSGALPNHCIEYLQVMVNSNHDPLKSCSLTQQTPHFLPLNPSSIQMHYSTANDMAKVTHSQSTLDTPEVPPHNFCNQSNMAKNQMRSETSHHFKLDSPQDNAFTQTLPHLYKQIPGSFKHDPKKDHCMGGRTDDLGSKDNLLPSEFHLNLQNSQQSQGKYPRQIAHSHPSQGHSDQEALSNQIVLHYGTLRRVAKGDDGVSDKQAVLCPDTIRNSMPDVRRPSNIKGHNSSSHRKFKKESDV